MKFIKMSLIVFTTWISFEFLSWNESKKDYVASKTKKICGVNKECIEKTTAEYYALMHVNTWF